MRGFRSPVLTAACLGALLVAPLWAGRRLPAPASAAWLRSVPSSRRASLLDSMRRLVSAEARQDWQAVYELRPELDHETETEPQFVQRWQETEPAAILDFEPLHADPSLMDGTSEDEQVFDVLGCVRVRNKGGEIAQEGSISAHLEAGEWSLDGIHLLTDDDDQPEPCRFHADRALLAAAAHGRH